MSTRKQRKKYRPVLSGTAIDHILSLCRKEVPLSSESISLMGILAPFQAKIKNDGIQEAYTTTLRESIEESLGMDLGAEATIIHVPTISKEEYWKQCYEVYRDNPEELSLKEIQAAREHMYLHGLMSVEEVEEFEKIHFKAD